MNFSLRIFGVVLFSLMIYSCQQHKYFAYANENNYCTIDIELSKKAIGAMGGDAYDITYRAVSKEYQYFDRQYSHKK